MKKKPAILLLCLLLLAVGVLLFTAPGRGVWILDPDSSAYVGLARSLASGEGFSFAGVAHVKFPPGFPFLLSLAIRATGDPECYAAMRDVATIAGLVCVLLSYFVGVSLFSFTRGKALLLALATGSSIYLAQYSVAFLRSETAFMAFYLASLVVGERWRSRGGYKNALGAALLAGAATLIRTAGVTAILALFLARFTRAWPPRLCLEGRACAEALLFLVVATLPAGSFALRNASLDQEASSGYMAELSQSYALDHTKDVDLDMPPIDAAGWVARLERNLSVLALSLGKFVVNDNAGANLAVDPHDETLRLSGLFILFLLLLGWVLLWKNGKVTLGWLLPGYIVLYLIWPFNQQQRFYLPILPILLATLAIGVGPLLRLAVSIANRAAGRWVMATFSLCFTAYLLMGRSDHVEVLGRYSKKYAALLLVAAIISIALLAVALWMGRRRAEPARSFSFISAAGLGLLALVWLANDFLFFRNLAAEQGGFTAFRQASPVDPSFERLKGLPEMFDLFEILKEHAGPDDLVMSDIPKMIHMSTGLRTTPFVFSSEAGTVELDRNGEPVRFLYFSREIPQVSEVFDRFYARHPERFEVLHEVRVMEGPREIPIYLLRVLDT